MTIVVTFLMVDFNQILKLNRRCDYVVSIKVLSCISRVSFPQKCNISLILFDFSQSEIPLLCWLLRSREESSKDFRYFNIQIFATMKHTQTELDWSLLGNLGNILFLQNYLTHYLWWSSKNLSLMGAGEFSTKENGTKWRICRLIK